MKISLLASQAVRLLSQGQIAAIAEDSITRSIATLLVDDLAIRPNSGPVSHVLT